MKIFSLTLLASAIVMPLAASASSVSTSTTIPLVTQTPASPSAQRLPAGPSVATLLTPQQLENAWRDYIAAQFNVDHSS